MVLKSAIINSYFCDICERNICKHTQKDVCVFSLFLYLLLHDNIHFTDLTFVFILGSIEWPLFVFSVQMKIVSSEAF